MPITTTYIPLSNVQAAILDNLPAVWEPNTLYAEGQQVLLGNMIYAFPANTTTGATFDIAEVEEVAGASGSTYAPFQGTITVADAVPTGAAVKNGYMWKFSDGGVWNTLTVSANDVIIANQDAPASVADYTHIPYGGGTASSNDRVFLDATSTAAADLANPTLAEIQTRITALGTTDTVVYYNGTDVAGTTPTYVYHIDNSGTVTELQRPIVAGTANNRVHLTNTAVTPAVAGAPTLAEIQAALTAAGSVDLIAYYTGDDNAATLPTHVYMVDGAGIATIVYEPVSSSTANNRVHLTGTAVAAVVFSAPSLAEIQTAVTAGAYTDVLAYYTNDDNPASAITYVYQVDGAGTATMVYEPTVAHVPNNSSHVTDATVTPAIAGSPTLAEIQTAVTTATLTDTLVYYTGDNSPASPATHLYWVDNSGTALLVESPDASFEPNDRYHIGSTALAPLAAEPTLAEVQTYLTAQTITDTLAYYTGDDTPASTPSYVYGVDKSGVATLLKEPVVAGTANNKVHLTATSVSAVNTSSPTLAEIQTAVTAAAVVDSPVYYTGDDNAASVSTHSYWSDGAGSVMLLNEPAQVANNRAHITDTVMAPAVAGSPTLTEAGTAIAAATLVDTVAYYTGTDLALDSPTYVYHVDGSGTVTELKTPHTAASNDRAHLTATVTAAANTAEPTLAEIQTAVTTATLTDVLVYYTGDDLPASDPTHVYQVDASGVATLLREPSSTTYTPPARYHVSATLTSAADVANPTIGEIEAALVVGTVGTLAYYTGDDNLASAATHLYWIDGASQAALIWTADVDAVPNNRAHITNTVMAPVSTGLPTDAEAQTAVAAAALTDTVIYYTGTDTATDAVTHSWHVDAAGVVTRMHQPSYSPAVKMHIASTSVGAADIANPTLIEIGVVTAAQKGTMAYYTGTDSSVDAPTHTYWIDGAGQPLLVEGPDVDAVANDRYHLTSTAVAPAAASPTLTEVQTAITTATVTDTLAYYTGDDNAASTPSYVYAVDNAGTVTLLKEPVVAGTANNKVHLTATSVAAATTSDPTLAEIQTAVTAGAITDSPVFYTGDDNAASPPTYSYWVDGAGSAMELRTPTQPANNRVHFTSTAVGAADTANPTLIEIQVVVTGTSVSDTTVYYTGDDLPASAPTRVYAVDGSGVATLVYEAAAADPSRVHLTDTDVGPASIGSPTLAELQAEVTAAGATDVVAYYTGDDNAASTPTYVVQVDGAGVATLIEEPEVNDAVVEKVNQTAHGLSLLNAVRFNGTAWVAAQATSGVGDAQGIVSEVVDVDNLKITTHGKVTATGHGLTVGEYYWLDQSVAGVVTLSQPATGILQVVLYARDANTIMVDIGQAMEVEVPVSATRVFLSDTLVSPAAALSPTVAEITAVIGANANVIAYYTGTDTDTNASTHVYHIDAAGAVTLIESPAASEYIEWTDYPMTIGGEVTAPTKGGTTVDRARYKVVGKTLYIRYDYEHTSAGGAGNGNYLFPLPAGYTPDLPTGVANLLSFQVIGKCAASDGGTLSQGITRWRADLGSIDIAPMSIGGFSGMGSSWYSFNSSSIGFSFTAEIPIL